MSSPAKSPQRSDGSYVKPGDSDYDEWSFVSKLTNPEEASFMTQSLRVWWRARGRGGHGIVSFWRHINPGLRAVLTRARTLRLSRRFRVKKTPQDLAQEAHDGDFDHLTHESSLSPLDRQGPRDALSGSRPGARVVHRARPRAEPPSCVISRRKTQGEEAADAARQEDRIRN